MNSFGVQQNTDMMRSSVVCPKPRRVAVVNHHLVGSLRWQLSHQIELCESNPNPGSEVLDLIAADPSRTVTSSPPMFFTGSPPSRVSNPLTKDSIFRDELLVAAVNPPSPSYPRGANPPPPPSPRSGGGCVRAASNFGNNPTVRVVGFNCLDRDRRSSSVATLA
ncbi:unnamed protein product [Cochlearia groenlandica]